MFEDDLTEDEEFNKIIKRARKIKEAFINIDENNNQINKSIPLDKLRKILNFENSIKN